jgi:uncharacterized protein (TIGR02145 family)
MALIICPECGKQISDTTEKCIHCGFPIHPSPKESNTPDVSDNSKLPDIQINNRPFYKNKRVILFSVIGVFIVFVSLYRLIPIMHSSAEKEQKRIADSTRNADSLAMVQAERQRIRDSALSAPKRKRTEDSIQNIKKELLDKSILKGQIVLDIDSNKYLAIQIGNQCWLTANLRVKRYNDGSSIHMTNEKKEWNQLKEGAFWKDSYTRSESALFYNWYAVDDKRGLCPKGWHIPTRIDWHTLEDFLGSQTLISIKNENISGDEGFCITYNRTLSDNVYGPDDYSCMWSSTEESSTCAYAVIQKSFKREPAFNNLIYISPSKNEGIDVRCIKDESSFKNVPAYYEKSVYSIGQKFGGGVIFYIDPYGEHGLIAATTDQANDIEYGSTIYVYTTSINIGAGKFNTKEIVNENSTKNVSCIAANLCWNREIDGYTDWFLPSINELNQLYCQKELIGGFNKGYYISSSFYYTEEIYYQDFSTGYQYKANSKNKKFSVRAIRYF